MEAKEEFERVWKMYDGRKIANAKVYPPEFKEEFRDFFAYGLIRGQNETMQKILSEQKCSEPECHNQADIFIIVKQINLQDNTAFLNKSAICPQHLLSFIEMWTPSIKRKHRSEGIKNLKLASRELKSPRLRSPSHSSRCPQGEPCGSIV